MDRRDMLRQAAKMYNDGNIMKGKILDFFNNNKQEVIKKAEERKKTK